MPLERFEAFTGLFPRWKTTPEIAKFTEEALSKFSVEQVRAAARQHRLERRGDDPDIGGVYNRLRQARITPERIYHNPAQAEEAERNRPSTPEERRWEAFMDSWRSDCRQATSQKPDEWATSCRSIVKTDLAAWGMTDDTTIDRFIRKIARDVGRPVSSSWRFTPNQSRADRIADIAKAIA